MREMKQRGFTATALYAALASVNFGAAPAAAAVNFTTTGQVVVDATDDTTWVTATPTDMVALPNFDISTGVLTGVTVSVNPSTRVESIRLVAPSRNSSTKTASGNTTGASTVTAPGGLNFSLDSNPPNVVVPGFFTTYPQNLTNPLSVSRTSSSSGTTSATGTTNTVSGSVSSTNATVLNSYVGAGNFNATLATPMQASLNISNCTNCSGGTATYSVAWSGTADVVYTSLLHAAPSFNGTNGDALGHSFGSLTVGDPVQNLAFSIFNLSGSRTGLDFTDYSLISGSGPFSLTTSSFANLAADDDSTGWGVSFDPNAAGTYNATYRLFFSDTTGTGASASQISSQYLDVVLSADVAPVPEPHEWAMMLAGLGMVGLIARRRRTATAG